MSSRLVVSAAALSLVALPVFAKDRVYDFSDFRQIEVSDGIELTVISGADSYRVEAEFSAILGGREPKISQHGQRLKIRRKARLSPLGKLFEDDLHVTVHLPELSGLSVTHGASGEMSGTVSQDVEFVVSKGGSLEAHGITAHNISLTASKGAELDIDGSCEVLEVEASDGADVDAQDLRCRTVEVSAMRGADVDVTATQALRASAALGGAISVAGKPANTQVSSSIGGSIQIED